MDKYKKKYQQGYEQFNSTINPKELIYNDNKFTVNKPKENFDIVPPLCPKKNWKGLKYQGVT